jgi:hypothetical protein
MPFTGTARLSTIMASAEVPMALMAGKALVQAAGEGFTLLRAHSAEMLAQAPSPKTRPQAAEEDAAQEQKAGGPGVIQVARPQKAGHDGVPEQHDDQAEQSE